MTDNFAGSTLTFAAGLAADSIADLEVHGGAAPATIYLRSAAPGTPWNINVIAKSSVTAANVSDSGMRARSFMPTTAARSTAEATPVEFQAFLNARGSRRDFHRRQREDRCARHRDRWRSIPDHCSSGIHEFIHSHNREFPRYHSVERCIRSSVQLLSSLWRGE